MRINFFEEFPNEENLRKLKLIDFKCLIFFASKSLEDFLKIKQRVKRINPLIESGYWPVLKNSYWISHFSHNSELKNLKKEAYKISKIKNIRVLLDFELPFLKKRLFLRNIRNIRKNKKEIEEILNEFKKGKRSFYAAEYPFLFIRNLMSLFGVSHPHGKYGHTNIIMFYTSMIKSNLLKKIISKSIINKRRSEDLAVGIGTTAKGILGSEPVISYSQFEKDINFCKENNINEIFIFRSGGLNKKFIEIIEKYR